MKEVIVQVELPESGQKEEELVSNFLPPQSSGI